MFIFFYFHDNEKCIENFCVHIFCMLKILCFVNIIINFDKLMYNFFYEQFNVHNF
jgi:hypothetical protein